jgi:hypothetical protein
MSMKSQARSAHRGSITQGLGASALLMVGLALTPLSEAIAADTPVQHSATQFAFNLPAEPLPQALNDFSAGVTGLSVVYTDEAPYGLQAPAINGRMSAEQALQQLLAQSGFNAPHRRQYLRPGTCAHGRGLEPGGHQHHVAGHGRLQLPAASRDLGDARAGLSMESRKPSTWWPPR